jgi:hypothetical protein
MTPELGSWFNSQNPMSHGRQGSGVSPGSRTDIENSGRIRWDQVQSISVCLGETDALILNG